MSDFCIPATKCKYMIKHQKMMSWVEKSPVILRKYIAKFISCFSSKCKYMIKYQNL